MSAAPPPPFRHPKAVPSTSSSSSSSSQASFSQASGPNVVYMSGCKVIFPEGKRAFPQQLAVMARLIAGADKFENCLLESPTGTGKTLALLCSSLAWQKASYAKQMQAYSLVQDKFFKEQQDKFEREQTEKSSKGEVTAKRSKADPNAVPQPPSSQLPTKATTATTTTTTSETSQPIAPRPTKIFFTSRTHTQIAQAIRALKTCHPEVLRSPSGGPLKMVVLGSRDQACVNARIKHLRGSELNDQCNTLVKNSREFSSFAPFERSRENRKVHFFSPHSFLRVLSIPQKANFEPRILHIYTYI